MRNLKEDAGAVACVVLQPFASAVLEINEYREGVVKNLVAARAVERREGTDATGIVFKLGTVEGLVGLGCHRFPFSCWIGECRAGCTRAGFDRVSSRRADATRERERGVSCYGAFRLRRGFPVCFFAVSIW